MGRMCALISDGPGISTCPNHFWECEFESKAFLSLIILISKIEIIAPV